MIKGGVLVACRDSSPRASSPQASMKSCILSCMGSLPRPFHTLFLGEGKLCLHWQGLVKSPETWASEVQCVYRVQGEGLQGHMQASEFLPGRGPSAMLSMWGLI